MTALWGVGRWGEARWSVVPPKPSAGVDDDCPRWGVARWGEGRWGCFKPSGGLSYNDRIRRVALSLAKERAQERAQQVADAPKPAAKKAAREAYRQVRKAFETEPLNKSRLIAALKPHAPEWTRYSDFLLPPERSVKIDTLARDIATLRLIYEWIYFLQERRRREETALLLLVA